MAGAWLGLAQATHDGTQLSSSTSPKGRRAKKEGETLVGQSD